MKAAYTVAWPRKLVEYTVTQFVLRAIEDGTGTEAVTSAMAEVDRLLRSVPSGVGESRKGTERILFVPPLAVTYEVREADRLVNVLRVSYRPIRPQT